MPGRKRRAIAIRRFVPKDIGPALKLWSRTEGLAHGESDTEPRLRAFLRRNPGFSAVASAGDAVVGAVLCGHNGRTGLLYHLAVSARYRRRGIGTRLVGHCFARLAAAGILRCNIYVYKANRSGNRFWLRTGWKDPGTWKVLQKQVLG